MGQAQVFPPVDYNEVSHIVSASTGKRLYTRAWKPEGEIRGVVYIVHGVFEHVSRYDDLAKTFNNAGLVVYGHDHVGHGYSEGDRVHIDNYSEYVNDVVQRIKSVREDHPGLPLTLFGHSMGGVVGFLTAAKNPDIIDFLVLSAPGLVADPEVATPLKIALAKGLSSLLPQTVVGKLPEEYITRNQAVRESLSKDPWRWQGGVKAMWGVATLYAQDEVKTLSADFKLPLLIIHGSADRISLPAGSRELVDSVGSEDKTFKDYEGGYHELFYEPDGMGEAVNTDITDWIKERVEKFTRKEPDC